MPVDGAYALETTLERIRQRYALYFHLPAGARQGEQRSISVELAAAASRRYPYAEVRYRREYYVSSAPPAGPDGAEAPTVITQAPQSDSGAGPARQRGRAVSQPDASHDGPLSPTGTESAAPAATDAPAPAPGAGTNNSGSTPGRWRKVKPGEPE